MTSPEIPRNSYSLATFGARIIAATVDLACVFLIVLLCGGSGISILLVFPESSPFVFWLFLFSSIPIAGIYFWLFFYLFSKTLGCLTVSIKIVRSDGKELGFGGGILRTLAFFIYIVGLPIGFSFLWLFDNILVACLIVLLVGIGVGIISMLFMIFDQQRRALHDRMAGTLVVENF